MYGGGALMPILHRYSRSNFPSAWSVHWVSTYNEFGYYEHSSMMSGFFSHIKNGWLIATFINFWYSQYRLWCIYIAGSGLRSLLGLGFLYYINTMGKGSESGSEPMWKVSAQYYVSESDSDHVNEWYPWGIQISLHIWSPRFQARGRGAGWRLGYYAKSKLKVPRSA